MALIQRPTKEGGALSYAAKVALGFTQILDVEVDADFDVVYALVNGNLDAANLKNLAVTEAKLATGAVTDAKVAAAAGIQGTKLGNLSIQTAKLTIGASVNARAQQQVSANTPFGVSNIAVVTLGITPRGGVVDAFASISGYVNIATDGNLRTLTLFINRGLNPLVSQSQQLALPPGTVGAPSLPFSLAIRYTDTGATPGVANQYQAILSTGGSANMTGVATSGQLHLQEPA